MPTLLTVKNIKKNYKSKEALKGVSFDLHTGEIFGLLGINGAGKTTLSSIIATLHPPSSGDIFWNDTSIYKNIVKYREIIGLCSQYPNLNPNLTLYDNLKYAGKFYKLDKSIIEERIKYLSEQLELNEYLSRTSNVLSGGYRQRFMIARSLIHNPKLLILDEPTVGLDPHIRREIWNIILNLKKQGITVILTTHYLDEAEYLSDRVCILHRGQIQLIDKPKSLKNIFQKNNLEEVFLTLMDEMRK